MTGRHIDWRSFVNRLVFCFGCGKFGLPRRGKAIPAGWKLIYQPHPEGRPGLHVCSEDCHEAVRLAMMNGPLTEPLMMPEPGSVMMPAEVRQAMEEEVEGELMKEALDARPTESVIADTEEGETDGRDRSATPAGAHHQESAQRPGEELERRDRRDRQAPGVIRLHERRPGGDRTGGAPGDD